MKKWIIYGANGYTGQILSREAKRRGLNPILAGRNSLEISALASELGLEKRVFDCIQPQDIVKHLKDVDVILHCAGPFSKTSQPMLSACLKTQTHYLDITGEIACFENIFSQNDPIRSAGIVVIPGVGFDVVPTDCLAAKLKQDMPDATQLRLGFKVWGFAGPGTVKTALEGLSKGGYIRKNGKLLTEAYANRSRKIQFNGRLELAVTIPWGDVSTAYFSTQIPNIEFYMRVNRWEFVTIKAINPLKGLFDKSMIQKPLEYLIERSIKGPNQAKRDQGKSIIWGEVSNKAGKTTERRLKCPHPIDLTVDAALASVLTLSKTSIPPGAYTPSKAFGADFINNLKGVSFY